MHIRYIRIGPLQRLLSRWPVKDQNHQHKIFAALVAYTLSLYALTLSRDSVVPPQRHLRTSTSFQVMHACRKRNWIEISVRFPKIKVPRFYLNMAWLSGKWIIWQTTWLHINPNLCWIRIHNNCLRSSTWMTLAHCMFSQNFMTVGSLGRIMLLYKQLWDCIITHYKLKVESCLSRQTTTWNTVLRNRKNISC